MLKDILLVTLLLGTKMVSDQDGRKEENEV